MMGIVIERIRATALILGVHKLPSARNGGGSIRKANETEPGNGVSTDQLVSAQEGLIPQITGTLTSPQITSATVFVDHATQFLLYVHLMPSLSTENTLEAKAACCERVFATYGHNIRAYRAS